MMEAKAQEDHYQSFQRHDSPTFSGERDPMVAQEWLDQLEEVFRVTRYSDQDKVELAIYRFRGEASQWWKRHREHMEATGGHICWKEFKTIFLNKYFPSNVKDQKEIEFITL
jgi:hypothetical protein